MYNRKQRRELITEQPLGAEAVDSLGIPGWDEVNQLVRALIGLSGLSVMNDQARNIQQLYADLQDYDKRPLTFTPRQPTALRGRFARFKGGYTTIDQMKRLFICTLYMVVNSCVPSKGVSYQLDLPASPPRLVEVIFLLLL